jgi:MFS family permease
MALDMFAVLLGGATYLLPIYAQDILHVGPQGFGWLRTAPAVGAFGMALLMAHLPPMRRAGRNLLLAVAGFGAATIVFGLSTSFWLSLAMLFLTGVFDNVSMVIRGTLIQLLTPDAMRGRVSAVNGVFIGASNQLGGLESGLVAHGFGAVFSVVSGGIGTIVVVLTTALSSRRLRAVDALHETRLDQKDEVSAAGGSS